MASFSPRLFDFAVQAPAKPRLDLLTLASLYAGGVVALGFFTPEGNFGPLMIPVVLALAWNNGLWAGVALAAGATMLMLHLRGPVVDASQEHLFWETVVNGVTLMGGAATVGVLRGMRLKAAKSPENPFMGFLSLDAQNGRIVSNNAKGRSMLGLAEADRPEEIDFAERIPALGGVAGLTDRLRREAAFETSAAVRGSGGRPVPARIFVRKSPFGDRIELFILDESRLFDAYTELGKTKNALEERLRFLDDFIEAAPNPMFHKDREGRYRNVNQAFLDLFDVRRDQALGRSIAEIVDASTADGHLEFDRAVLADGAGMSYEWTMIDGKGVLRTLRTSKAAHRDGKGEVAGVIGVVTDVTPLKAAQAELIAALGQSESLRRLADQAREAALAAKAEAIEMADEALAADRAKSEFLAVMSHEIRTPMNGVLGLVELALNTELTPEQRDLLAAAHDSADLLLTLINDILDFSKIEAREMALEAVEFSPAQIVQTVVGVFRRQAGNKGLSLDAVVDPASPGRVLGDPVRFRQVLTNLVGNAVKFTESGGALVRLTPGDAPGMVRVAVRDSGVGVPQDRLESIFEPFKQADGSITRRFGGTGLGLALVKRLVGLMGGEVEVSSTPGLGSEFRFSARFAPCAAPVRELAAASKPVPARKPLPPLSILLVEDNPVNVKLGSAMLGKLGVEVRVAGDGEEALDLLKAWTPDLVFMDIEMPIMDGLEAARRLRAGEAGRDVRDVPVYALTAHALPEYESVCFDMGMNGCLTKPLSFMELSAFLGEFSAAKALAESRRTPEPPVLCRDAALAFCGDEQCVETLTRVFLADLPKRSAALKTALESLDRPALKIAAHSLKSSCALVGAGACREAALNLETLLDVDAEADPSGPTRRLLGALDVLDAALTGRLADMATATVGPTEHRA